MRVQGMIKLIEIENSIRFVFTSWSVHANGVS